MIGEEGLEIFVVCLLNLFWKELGLIWLVVIMSFLEDVLFFLLFLGRLKCIRSLIFELDRGLLWFIRIFLSLGFGGCFIEGGFGLGEDGCCLIIVRLVVELVE